MKLLPISKKIIDISKRLIGVESADGNENTKIELYKDGMIVAGSARGINVSRLLRCELYEGLNTLCFRSIL